MKMIKDVIKFFDKLEDKVRGRLTRYPIIYAFIGGIGIVLFWRGVWHIADDINISSTASIIIGSVILLMTGLMVYDFIGNRIISSGIDKEKKLVEKEEGEIKIEKEEIKKIQETLSKVEEKISDLETKHIDK